MSCADHFSDVARDYAVCRPTYPSELFDYLADTPARRELAWDAGAGSGQATLPLADRFAKVVATDTSARQLAMAPARSNVELRCVPAETSGLVDAEVDLVTVAQALHWFELERFYAEVRRVLRPGGWIAVWSYGPLSTGSDPLDRLLRKFHDERVGSYWPAERRHVDEGYRSLSFPFREVEPPRFAMEASWTLNDLMGYIGTWSAVSAYKRERHEDPVHELALEMKTFWPGDVSRLVTWPLTLRVGQ